MVDARAKRILFRTYWSHGWIEDDERSTPPDDLAYAMAQGVMFDPVSWSHDESVEAVQAFRERSFAQRVGAVFVASLSSRRLDLRSALASWSMIEHVASHPYVGAGHACNTCRDARPDAELVAWRTSPDLDLNVLSFERLKWGGVRHDQLDYARFDLERFALTEPVLPTPTDRDLFRTVLDTISAVPETTTAGGLVRALKPALPGTAAEHRALVEILGASGVLRPGGPDRPEHARSDWGASGQWRGGDRYDEQRVHLLLPAL
ncbi:hypothetical protein [Oerskovia flava]|uniref:hypothetical protein n=1 Tax=Oerskovia flava TaxID=2986422 RepID=UPI00223F24C3|nr:hypothetical protein [Oerskovia sp. JB1-3-2]